MGSKITIPLSNMKTGDIKTVSTTYDVSGPKIAIPISGGTNTIVSNIRVTDAKFVQVNLVVDSHTISGVLKDGIWHFNMLIPMFCLHNGCYITVQPSALPRSIDVKYDIGAVPPLTVQKSSTKLLTSGTLTYYRDMVC